MAQKNKTYISQHLSFQIPRKWRCHAMPKSQISSWALSISPGRFPQCSRGRWLCPRVLVLEPSGSVFNSDVEKPMGKKKRFGKCYIHGGGVNIYVSLRAIIKRWLKSFPESIKEYHWSSKSSHSTTENFGYSEPSGNGMCTIQSWDSVRKKKARVPDVLSLGFHRTFGSSRFGLMGFWPPNQQHQSMSCFQDGTCWNFLEQICPEDSFTFGVSSHKKMSSRVCNHADAGLATCRSLGDFQTSSDQMVLNMVVVWMPQSSPPLDLYPINWTGIHVTYVNYANI